MYSYQNEEKTTIWVFSQKDNVFFFENLKQNKKKK